MIPLTASPLYLSGHSFCWAWVNDNLCGNKCNPIWGQLVSVNRCCWVLDKPGSQIAEQCSPGRDSCDIALGPLLGVWHLRRLAAFWEGKQADSRPPATSKYRRRQVAGTPLVTVFTYGSRCSLQSPYWKSASIFWDPGYPPVICWCLGKDTDYTLGQSPESKTPWGSILNLWDAAHKRWMAVSQGSLIRYLEYQMFIVQFIILAKL